MKKGNKKALYVGEEKKMKYCNNKMMKVKYYSYKKSYCYDLYHCYGKYSISKEYAMKYCRELEEKYNGHSLKIISYNTSIFTVGFIGYIDGKEAFFYITRDYDKYIFLEDIEK